jgi:hypothetical protein
VILSQQHKKTAGDIKSGAKEAKFKAVDAPAARYASRRGIGGPAPGLAARAKDPAKRRALRSTVLKDIGSRAKAKLGRGIEKARAAGERVVGAVKSSSDATQAKAREAGSSAKAGAKGLVGRAARAVSRGARSVARRLGEDVDLYDIVLEHLLDEGFAETEEAATVIMANMSEEWRESIVDDIDEGYKKLPVGKMMRKVFSKAYNRGVENARNPDSKKGSEAFANSAKMTGVAKDHNPEASQERERQNRIRGGKR